MVSYKSVCVSGELIWPLIIAVVIGCQLGRLYSWVDVVRHGGGVWRGERVGGVGLKKEL